MPRAVKIWFHRSSVKPGFLGPIESQGQGAEEVGDGRAADGRFQQPIEVIGLDVLGALPGPMIAPVDAREFPVHEGPQFLLGLGGIGVNPVQKQIGVSRQKPRHPAEEGRVVRPRVCVRSRDEAGRDRVHQHVRDGPEQHG